MSHARRAKTRKLTFLSSLFRDELLVSHIFASASMAAVTYANNPSGYLLH